MCRSYFIFILSGILFPLASSAQIDEHRDIKPFSRLLISGNLDVDLVKSDEKEILIYSDQNIKPEVIFTRNRGDLLEVVRLKANGYEQHKIKVTIYYQNIESLELSNGVSLKHSGKFSGNQLVLHVGANAQITSQCALNALEIKAENGAQIQLSGSVDLLVARLKNGSELNALGLFCQRGKVEANAGSKAFVTVVKSLEAEASAGSKIEFKGSPEEVIIKTTFGGEVTEG